MGGSPSTLKGSPLVPPGVLMNRAALGVLIDELEAFSQAAEGIFSQRPDRAAWVWVGGRGGRPGVPRRRPRRPDVRRASLQLASPQPPSTPRERSWGARQADLLQADSLFRGELRTRLRDVLPRLDRIRRSPDWGDPLKTVDGMRVVPYDLIEL